METREWWLIIVGFSLPRDSTAVKQNRAGSIAAAEEAAVDARRMKPLGTVDAGSVRVGKRHDDEIAAFRALREKYLLYK